MYVVNTHEETHSIKTVNKRKDSNGIDRHGQRVPLRGSFRRQYHFAINKQRYIQTIAIVARAGHWLRTFLRAV